ncbi:hypothetical protein DFS34DRAFT_92447 [Phlyctochytrium arcticum]|nr:hypothetical protein DFS34DRAFT_92447 [Phlyctochytrium arcticum]
MSGTGTPTRRESTLGSTERLSRAGSTTRGIAAPEDGAGSGRGSMTGRGSSASSGGQQPQQRGSIGENSTLAPAAAQQHHRYHRDDTEGDSDADLESEVELEEEELESSTETARSILGALVDHHAPGGAAAAGGDPSSTGTNDDPAVAAAIEKEDARDEAGEGEGDGDTSILADIQSTLDFLSAQTPTAAQAPQDPTLTRLRTEYDKLHKLFLQSRKNEKSLMTKCKSLSSELSSNAAKVAAALKLSQNDRSQITALKKEVRKCWKMVEIGQEKETRAKEAIAQLKGDVEGLRKQMVDVAGSVPGGPAYASFGRDKLIEMQIQQDELIRSLTEQREALQKETLQKTTDLANLQLLTTDLESRVEKLVSERGSLDHELLTLKDLLATKKSELDREARAREKLEVALRQSIDGSTKKDELVTAKMVEVKSARDGIVKLEAVIKEERAKVAVSDKEKENLVARLGRLQQEYDEQVLTTTRLLSENQAQTGEIKGWEEELQKYKEEVRSVVRVRDALQKRIKLVEDGKLEAEVERDQLKGTTHALSHDLETARRSLDQFHKNLDTLTRERDIALKNVTKATAQTTKQVTVVKLADQTKRNLEQEIAGYKDEAAKMRKLIYTLEKDRDRWINEGGKIRLELAAKEEEGKIGEMLLFDCRKKITELERKLKEQQSLYENVRADRNLYSKNLVESQDEITEMRRKLKIMTHQIEQLKEEIANKEGALVKEHFEHSKLEKEKEALSVQIGKLQLQYEEAQQMIQNQVGFGRE